MTNNVYDVQTNSVTLKSSAFIKKKQKKQKENRSLPSLSFSFDVLECLNAKVNDIRHLKYTLDFF